MYVFVRFTGIVLVVFGLLLMVAGFGGAFVFGGALYIVGWKDALIDSINSYLLSTGSHQVITGDTLPALAVYALVLFVAGMLTAAFGQLMLVFADIGTNSRETNILLRRRNTGGSG